MDLQRMVQVDGGEAVSLETFFKVNTFSDSERADCLHCLKTFERWGAPIGGGGEAVVLWATQRAAMTTEYADWLLARPQYESAGADEHLAFNHDLTDEDRTWLERFCGRWKAMEMREQRAAHVHTNDLGLAIRDALDSMYGIVVMDWSKAEPTDLYIQQDIVTDAGHGFSDLRVEVGGAHFRVSITRIG